MTPFLKRKEEAEQKKKVRVPPCCLPVGLHEKRRESQKKRPKCTMSFWHPLKIQATIPPPDPLSKQAASLLHHVTPLSHAIQPMPCS